ncbi:ABC transporter permease [Brevibacillus fluminis]|uniref:ABC transporter permease n=1 Tax=Brevibacillus fluminis TaxID=511487 RepID=UPI003F8B8B09
MREWLALVWAEIKKEHRNSFHSNLIYFSLLLWPIVMFVTSYYSFFPFARGADSPLARFVDPDQLVLYLLTGYLGYIFFWCLVQSAWRMSFERQAGTMEMIFIAPVNRLAFVFGRTISSLAEGVWLFLSFVLIAIVLVGGLHISGWWSIPLAFLILVVSAVVWGGLLTVLFLFSRDSSFLYTILDEPMLIFAGVRIPPLAFPFWAKLISLCFPLTYALAIIRKLLLDGAGMQDILPDLTVLAGVLLGLVGVTAGMLRLAERRMKRTGSMVLY